MYAQNIPNISKELIEHKLLKRKDASDELSNYIKSLRREEISKPVIYIGASTCGIVAGANKTIDAVHKYLNDREIIADVIPVGCIGMCSIEPILDIQLPGRTRVSFQQVTAERVPFVLDGAFNKIISEPELIGQFETEEQDLWEGVPLMSELDYFKLQKRIVLKNTGIIDPTSIDEYIAHGGYQAFMKCVQFYTYDKISDVVLQSGLRGRGGGGFPTGEKWKIAFNTTSDQKYIVCNADESDPGAFMDRAIIEGDPHRLIEGMAIAAYGIGATRGIIYIRARYPLAVERIELALKQAKEYGFLGNDIFESGFSFDITIKKGPGAFVCGEETALINSLEGKRGMPRPKPFYPAEKGLFGKPTVVNNVETLANVPAIFDKGPDWFSDIGTETSKGTKVFALSGKIGMTGLVEVPMGTSIRDIIYRISGGIKNKKQFKALQIGGPSGACITEENLDIPVDYETLESIGAKMGSGGIVVMDEDTCIIDTVKFFMDFLQKESCGKCIPCREGTSRMLEIFENITRKPSSEDGHETLERFKGVMQLENLAEVIQDTSLCGLGQTASDPVLSTLKYFREEYEEHIFDRKCRAGVCRELRTFEINVDKCTGCTACAKKCPANAIIGNPRQPYFIVQDKCIACGMCMEICKFGAVVSD